MCFSASASFTSGAVLGTLGVGAISRVKASSEIPFASIPLIFSFQQIIEGFLWIALKDSSTYVVPLTYAFLFFALLWWPLYMPFVAYTLETHKIRKTILMLVGLIGLAEGSVLYLIFLRNPSTAYIVNHCVYYPLNLPHWAWFAVLYGVATIGPGVISSNPKIRLFSALLFIFGLLAWFSYRVNFISVWCFFAAILSLVIFFSFTLKHSVSAKI